MSTKQPKVKTVSDKITESFLPQTDQDPEDDPENLVRIADFDDDEADETFDATNLGASEIRKRNVKLLSEFSDKYKGKVTSRKELQSESEASHDEDDLSEDDESDSDAESEINAFKSQLNDEGIQTIEQGNISVEESKDSDSEDDEVEESETEITAGKSLQEKRDLDYEDSNEDEEDDDDNDDNSDDDETEEIEDSDYASSGENQPVLDESSTKLFSASNQNAEVLKGLAVQNQLKIWEKLLEIRIHSQKMLTKANSFPPPKIYSGLCEQSNDFKKLAQEATTNVSKLLENMLDIQHILANQFQEMEGIIKSAKKRPSSSGKSTAETEIKRFASALTTNFEAFKPYRNSVLQKWDDRTKILAAGAGSKKGSKSLADNFDIVKKIDAVLLNKSELINKARTVKGNYKLFGMKEDKQDQSASNENGDDDKPEEQKQSSNEIYDDTDFYHQQLRELIEYKSNISSNPAEMSKQFAELQKLRQKMKKKVDTRASKGRKIRYVVHNKLVNFMAPDSNCDWTEDSKTELYRSLFAT